MCQSKITTIWPSLLTPSWSALGKNIKYKHLNTVHIKLIFIILIHFCLGAHKGSVWRHEDWWIVILKDSIDRGELTGSLRTSFTPTCADAVGAVWGEPGLRAAARAPLGAEGRRRRWGGCRDPAAGPGLTGETVLLRRRMMLLAAADSEAALVVEVLQPLLLLERMSLLLLLLGMESEGMPVAKQRQLHYSGPVKARLARGAFALEGFEGAVRTPLLSAHLRCAGPLICGLHLSLHTGRVSSCSLWRAGLTDSWWVSDQTVTVWLGFPSHTPTVWSWLIDKWPLQSPVGSAGWDSSRGKYRRDFCVANIPTANSGAL